ncbi:uncharacterized protein PpBr36_11020 [Pyricularia pennisetigena]|uniref:uncharacterized protein n=1 Tax=Pyricularia pennisetigena TaxID=1578925 RepID=UPI001152CD98|nr:uncharacterized protein PpBr36_11020 [Pyricularia pennisetigena]TLS20761.1 hypothetical protein PpBr36_11020 [Pyricularia pennisetigena]
MDTSKQVSVPAPAPQAPPATPAPAAPPASAAPAPLDFINKSSGGGMGFSKVLVFWFIVPFVFNNNLNAGNDVEDFFSKYMAAQLLHYVCSDIRKFAELVLGGVQKFACDNQAKSDDVLIVKLPET